MELTDEPRETAWASKVAARFREALNSDQSTVEAGSNKFQRLARGERNG